MFHKGKYYVTFKRGFDEHKKDIIVVVDKVFEKDCVKITLSDEEDPAFLSVLTITRSDYEELKKQQGLLIDFDNFPSQLVRLLQLSASNNMFLQMQQTNPIQYFFEIVEHNEFKRLVHLSLRTGPATDADIKQHMAETINNLKKSLSAHKNAATSSDALWNDKCINLERKVHDLSHALNKMEEDKARKEMEFQDLIKQEKERLFQERQQWQKNAELNSNNQLAVTQDNLNRKDRQIDELNSICKQLKENILHLENQLSDKSQRLNVLETEVQKTHIEVATMKAKNVSLERDISDKEKLCAQLSSKCVYMDQTIKDNADTIKELNTSLQIIKKEKASLEERLALSESLANKNNEAAHSTSEQLLKANQIISKQNCDLIEMKEKLLCRTAIALEQEKVIEKYTKEMEDLKSEIDSTNRTMLKLKEELNALVEKYQSNEQALKDRDETIKNNNMVIQWLHKKMEDSCAPADGIHQKYRHGIHTATSSTPYFLPRSSQNNVSEMSDMSINFYANSKSNIEESPGPQVQENSGKVGLDPRYLKPATEDTNKNVPKDTTSKQKNTDMTANNIRGKENKIVTLPKVDYREKKTSRASTYKATPVSAYFP
ncbi:spindle assembly abnormal protein 6 homolog [Ostrinia furnacalis]|uniref:spindle assembly abnormal protein 6 homolog n=1 Tax=Ostrinia furnacalis TaxID=93504 RepID=UPI001038E209|nr:spindle assembly abnormal protein 6 homolog [Ostrinia furnacalis]